MGEGEDIATSVYYVPVEVPGLEMVNGEIKTVQRLESVLTNLQICLSEVIETS